jgi:hypothetical protein
MVAITETSTSSVGKSRQAALNEDIVKYLAYAEEGLPACTPTEVVLSDPVGVVHVTSHFAKEVLVWLVTEMKVVISLAG